MLPPIGGEAGSARSFIGQPLSRDQLRDCIRQQRAIDADSYAAKRAEAAMAQRRDTLEAEEQSINGRRSTIDARSQQAVDTFNASVKTHIAAINLYNHDVNQARQRVEGLNEKVTAFNTGCAGRAYYVDDMDAVLAALGPSPAPPTNGNFRAGPSSPLIIGQ